MAQLGEVVDDLPDTLVVGGADDVDVEAANEDGKSVTV